MMAVRHSVGAQTPQPSPSDIQNEKTDAKANLFSGNSHAVTLILRTRNLGCNVYDHYTVMDYTVASSSAHCDVGPPNHHLTGLEGEGILPLRRSFDVSHLVTGESVSSAEGLLSGPLTTVHTPSRAPMACRLPG